MPQCKVYPPLRGALDSFRIPCAAILDGDYLFPLRGILERLHKDLDWIFPGFLLDEPESLNYDIKFPVGFCGEMGACLEVLLALVPGNHHLVDKPFNDKDAALVKAAADIPCAGFWHDLRLQRDVVLQARVINLYAVCFPPVKSEYSHVIPDYFLAFSSFPLSKASRLWSFTFITCHRTPGMSPFDLPMAPPMHSTRTSSCSSISFVAPSPGQNAVICFPFFMSWMRTHFLIAEFGCFASSCTFSRTMPFAWDAPPSGSDFFLRLLTLLTYHLFCHLAQCLLSLSFFPAFIPFDLLPILLDFYFYSV